MFSNSIFFLSGSLQGEKFLNLFQRTQNLVLVGVRGTEIDPYCYVKLHQFLRLGLLKALQSIPCPLILPQ